MGCDFYLAILSVNLCLFQSTHPRGVRRENRAGSGCDNKISIHAPTWGATQTRLILEPSSHFNPRTHVGCDPMTLTWMHLALYFNPRTHVGCDAEGGKIHYIFEISIHAPTWGATLKGSKKKQPNFYFNPRTHVGCDENK